MTDEKLIEEAFKSHDDAPTWDDDPVGRDAAIRWHMRGFNDARAVLEKAHAPTGVVAEEPEWEWGSEGKEGTSDPDPRPLEDDRPYWPEHLTGVRELTREQAESVIAAWNEGDPESSSLIRRRKAGPWVPVKP